MDVRRYADLFLSESREHLTAFNHLLLEWERDPAAREPVDGIFRAAHSLKGMAATMGRGGSFRPPPTLAWLAKKRWASCNPAAGSC